jgi:hypothetical protein
MKTFLKILLICFGTIFLFACNKIAGTSVMKRHYRPGFYVHNGHRADAVQKKTKAGMPENKNSGTPAVAYKLQETELTPVKENEVNTLPAPVSQKENTAAQNPEKLIPQEENSGTVTRNDNKISAAKINRAGEKKAMGRGIYNLLWIAAVVLLVLWLVGLASGGWGISGLIHILLVVALVLFIIWLIRAL